MRSCVRRAALISALCLAGTLGASGVALAAAPMISGISPNNGSDAGGMSVTITGTGFITGSTVKFGSVAGTGVTIHSTESITATSPAGSGSELVNVTVTNTNGTSAAVPKDQFAYDPAPVSPWLGLNGDSSSNPATNEWLGPVNEFSQYNIDYDRSFEIPNAGETPSQIEPDEGKPETYFEYRLKYDYEYGMTPVSVIEYKGYGREGYEWAPDPEFPQERSKKEEEEGKNSIKGYVAGFVKSASAILKNSQRKISGHASVV